MLAFPPGPPNTPRHRRSYDEATRNPLRRHYHNRGRDDEKLDTTSTPDEY